MGQFDQVVEAAKIPVHCPIMDVNTSQLQSFNPACYLFVRIVCDCHFSSKHSHNRLVCI